MSKRGEELLIASLSDRWSANHTPSIGVTCTANVNAQFTSNGLGNKYKHNLTSLSYSLNAVKSAGVSTMTLSVRDASIGGPVRAQWAFVVAAAGAQQGTLANLDIPGLNATDLFAEFGAPNASVSASVTMAGWTDRMVNG
jgi:hypothetical protein